MRELLFISEYDETKLPEEYHFSHNIAVRLHDDLVAILKDKSIQKKLTFRVNLKSEDAGPKENEEEILDWLNLNGHKQISEELVSRHLVMALTSDICHFVYQSLNSAKHYKLSVAYSLVRKPFLENLLIIEQLLNDEKEFLSKFETNPENFDPGKIKDDTKKLLIDQSLEKTKAILLDSDLVFEVRFDKKSDKGFYAMSNLATHLVTTRHPTFKTESLNLNFIFSGYEQWESQLDHFYYFFPYILFYATEVIDRYLFEKKMINRKIYKKRKFYRLISQILVHDQFDRNSMKGNSAANKISRQLKVKCKSCKKSNQLHKSDLFTLIKSNYLLCKHCLVDLYNENNSMDEIFEKIIDI
ncbi:hypothetical protein [Flavobacterium sp.]|uniref:hypothetical protein n=1 Tax=Flavobacterium sp. TaxID=239 RepID=UPI0031E3DDB8